MGTEGTGTVVPFFHCVRLATEGIVQNLHLKQCLFFCQDSNFVAKILKKMLNFSQDSINHGSRRQRRRRRKRCDTNCICVSLALVALLFVVIFCFVCFGKKEPAVTNQVVWFKPWQIARMRAQQARAQVNREGGSQQQETA